MVVYIHDNERALMTQVRPDPTAAPTGMTAPTPSLENAYVDEFGNVIYPVSFDYLTPVSVGDLGETLTTITSTPITIGGSTYTHSMVISDRTLGPVECTLTITGTGATTLSWLSNGRASGDSGTGASYQPGEFYLQREGFSDVFFLGNPNRDGQTATAFTPNGEPRFPYVPYPERDTRVHAGRPLYYRASGSSFESCCNPMDFMHDSPTTAWNGSSSLGDNASQSNLWFGHRLSHACQLGYGSTDAVRAVTHSVDFWSYAPSVWDSTADTNGPITTGRFFARYVKPNYFNEAKVYDLANFGSPITLASFEQQTGVDNFNDYYIARDRITSTINGVASQQVRSPVASKYVAIIFRNTTTDIAIALACYLPSDETPGSGLRNTVLGGYNHIYVANYWDASEATGLPTQPYTVHLDGYCKAYRRERGWIGSKEFCCIGLTAHVHAAVQALYANGDLDLDPATPNAASTAGTVFDEEAAGLAAQTLGRIKSLVRLRWERTTS